MSHSVDLVDLDSECKGDNMVQYRVEYTIPHVKPGRYICQIQSKCYFGVSEMSDEISVWNEEEVSFVLLSIMIKLLNVYCHEVIFLCLNLDVIQMI